MTVQIPGKASLPISALVLDAKGDCIECFEDLWPILLPMSKTDILLWNAKKILIVEALKRKRQP